MSFNNKNVAYDLSLFEESTKKNNIVRLPKKSQRKKAKINVLHAFVLGIASVFTIGIVGTFVCSQVKLNELTAQITAGEKALNESESAYTQLQVKSETKMSLSVIENFAANNLNMTKIDPSQVEYINLSIEN